ncbi:hypothetical protein DRQ09_00165 [candidate division KSB1 bacterium]|nr:MAG: hypothetical protein DRQ09_00165 [candidate division KSB1 bacterium]
MKKFSYILIIFFIVSLTGESSFSQVFFADVTDQMGVGSKPEALLCTNHTWGDYDNDGDLDLFVTYWGTAVNRNVRNLLFRNDGSYFTEVWNSIDNGNYNSVYAAWADYDNDGDLDLYVVNFYEQDILYENRLIPDGEGFTNVTSSAGINIISEGYETSMAWGDYDGDGFVDIYLCKYSAKNELYHNNGDGSFSRITDVAKTGDIRDSNGAAWVDYDQDGFLDLYVVNRDQDSKFYHNNGDGTFTDYSWNTKLNSTALSRGCFPADYDNDGYIDIFLANIGKNYMYKYNPATGSFTNIASQLGVSNAGNGWDTWGAAWGDYDADGDLDLFVVGGAEDFRISNAFLENRNIGGVRLFSDVIDNVNVKKAPFYNVSLGTSVSFADFDNDNDPDLYITGYSVGFAGSLYNFNRLYQNLKSADGNDFLKVRVKGMGAGHCNTAGIGSKIKVYEAGTLNLAGYREIMSGSSPLEAIFGLDKTKLYDVEVIFLTAGTPGGKKVKESSISPGQVILIEEK